MQIDLRLFIQDLLVAYREEINPLVALRGDKPTNKEKHKTQWCGEEKPPWHGKQVSSAAVWVVSVGISPKWQLNNTERLLQEATKAKLSSPKQC